MYPTKHLYLTSSKYSIPHLYHMINISFRPLTNEFISFILLCQRSFQYAHLLYTYHYSTPISFQVYDVGIYNFSTSMILVLFMYFLEQTQSYFYTFTAYHKLFLAFISCIITHSLMFNT